MNTIAKCILIFFLFFQPLITFGNDSIDFRRITINGLDWGKATESSLISKLGIPKKRIKVHQDFNSEDYWKVCYKIDFYFISKKRKINGFNLKDPRSYITIEKTIIKMGMPIGILKRLFPSSYAEFKKNGIFRVKLNNIDSYIIFSIKKDEISSIESWEDN